MIEYTRELLNSNCDLDFINILVERANGRYKIIKKGNDSNRIKKVFTDFNI